MARHSEMSESARQQYDQSLFDFRSVRDIYINLYIKVETRRMDARRTRIFMKNDERWDSGRLIRPSIISVRKGEFKLIPTHVA
ncbi:hypothetical protein PoB_004775700 [Plakobranchus ocellatus]|uniref:Uncharacterized protein n=1 Tax=Plakobranchus ocellatus TaxID=259542 RepID=A0AAV4BPG6_9GAST|nr:hypothetical protein PoB_004775700 [Plakobranchus ocellatus]